MSVKRLYWADCCRVVAMIGVVLLHSSAATFYQFNPKMNWYLTNFLDSSARFCVPLFLLLSGALLLNKPGDLPTVGKVLSRCWKVILPFL